MAPTLKETDKEDFENLLFKSAVLPFSLKNIQRSVKLLKDVLTSYAGTNGCTLMYKDEYNYLWKIGERTTLPFKVGVGAAGLAAKSKKIVIIEDTRKDPVYVRVKSKTYKSLVAIPILDEHKNVLGVLNFTYKDFNKSLLLSKKQMKDIAEKLVTILENIILYYQAEKQKRELKASKNISAVLGSPGLPAKQKLAQIAGELAEFLEIEKAKIYTFRENKTDIFNKKGNATEGLLPKEAYQKNNKFSLLDITEKMGGKKFRTAQPILNNKKVIGFIMLEDKVKNINNISVQQRNFLQLISSRIGSFISQEESSQRVIDEKEKWRLIFHNVEDAIILLSKEQVIVDVNQRAKEILGSKNISLTGRSLFSLFRIMDLEVRSSLLSLETVQQYKTLNEEELSKKINGFFEKGKRVMPKEYLIETAGGKFWTMVSMKTVIKRWNDENYGVLHVRDISKRKKLEQDKNEFMSMVSHELRTPLSSMKGYLSMTLNNDYGRLNEMQTSSLKKMENSTDRMIGLVEDLLDVSRIELGRINLQKEPVDTLEVILKSLQEIGQKITKKRIRVRFQGRDITGCIKNNKKPKHTKSPIYVWGDNDRILQVMQNLIDNAVKYSFEKTLLSISVNETGQYAEIKIEDQGVGIPKEDLDKLFKKFSRIHNALSVQAGGTGLGLYITKRLINAHGGRIDVTSVPDKGSIFTVGLPIAKQLPLI